MFQSRTWWWSAKVDLAAVCVRREAALRVFGGWRPRRGVFEVSARRGRGWGMVTYLAEELREREGAGTRER